MALAAQGLGAHSVAQGRKRLYENETPDSLESVIRFARPNVTLTPIPRGPKSLGQRSCRTKFPRIFQFFLPDFAPNFALNFPRIFQGFFVLRFV